MEEQKKPIENQYELVQIPTGQAIAIQSPDGKVLDNSEALVEILNILQSIKKAVI